MIKSLYKVFKHWSKTGSVYIISDPHFMDYDMNWRIKDVPTFMNLPEDDESIAKTIAYYIVDEINKVCKKDDTLIVEGDIGDVSFISKIKSGYKILIKGNHDVGSTKYSHTIKTITKPLHTDKQFKDFQDEWGYVDGPGDWAALTSRWEDYCKECAIEEYKNIPGFDGILDFKYNDEYDEDDPFKVQEPWNVVIGIDNKLFDEVYDGPLMICDRIILSHEPIQGPWVNIHGHEHFTEYTDGCNVNTCYDLDRKIAYKTLYINTSVEVNGFKPINLGKLIDTGIMSKIDSIHRVTIDKASKKE